jgi:hypothetical protein
MHTLLQLLAGRAAHPATAGLLAEIQSTAHSIAVLLPHLVPALPLFVRLLLAGKPVATSRLCSAPSYSRPIS